VTEKKSEGDREKGCYSHSPIVIPAKAGIYEYPLENGTRFPGQACPRENGDRGMTNKRVSFPFLSVVLAPICHSRASGNLKQ